MQSQRAALLILLLLRKEFISVWRNDSAVKSMGCFFPPVLPSSLLVSCPLSPPSFFQAQWHCLEFKIFLCQSSHIEIIRCTTMPHTRASFLSLFFIKKNCLLPLSVVFSLSCVQPFWSLLTSGKTPLFYHSLILQMWCFRDFVLKFLKWLCISEKNINQEF